MECWKEIDVECPNCGGEADINFYGILGNSVKCPDCGANGYLAWNNTNQYIEWLNEE